MAKRNEEVGFSSMKDDSTDNDRIPGDRHHDDATTPLPMVSLSPLPHWNLNETSQYYCNQPAGGNSMIDFPQFGSHQNFQMDYHNYLHQGEEHNVLPCRPDYRLQCPEGYVGLPYQYNRLGNLTVPADVKSAAFNLNNFENPDSGGIFVTPNYGSASRPPMLNPSGTVMNGNIGQPPLDKNLGMALCNPNQGDAEPLLAIGKFDERFMAVSSGSNNNEYISSAVLPNFNVNNNSEMEILPSVNTYHNQLGSISSLTPGLDLNDACSAFQNGSEIMSDLARAGNHESLFDSRHGLHLGPSYAFQRPAAGHQNQYFGQVNRDLGLGGVKDIGMDFTNVGQQNGLERCLDLNSSPTVGHQAMPFQSGQSWANGQLVPTSRRMVTDKLPKLSSQSFPSPPSAMATRSTRGLDPPSNHGQFQALGSIQQSNSSLQAHCTSGMQTGMGNMTAQVSRPSIMSSLKRAASQPLSSTQNQQRRTLPSLFVHRSTPTWTRLAPSVPNPSRTIPPLVHPAQSLTPQAAHSVVPPRFPSTGTQSALPGPITTQANPLLMHRGPFLPPNNDKRISSFHHPSSHTSPHTNQFNHQQRAQSLARQRLKGIIPSSPSIASSIKDQTPEPIGYKCFLCKRDLSYEPEGPISQPRVSPPVAVLPCGHTFHDYCLERITPHEQSKDPPCIPCALPDQ